MRNEQAIEYIKELGLSEFEARVYYAALYLGPTTMLKISRLSGIKRSTVYTVMEELLKRGFMRIEPHGFKKLFAAEHPRTLESKIEERRKKFHQILPTLEAMYNQPETHSVIKYYEGLEAVKGVYSGLLNELRPKDDYMVISNMKTWLALDEKFFLSWREKRSKLNLKSRLIFVDNEIGRKYKKLAPNFFEKVKLLPKESQFETALVLTPRKAIVHQQSEPVTALVNESNGNIKLYIEMFEFMWNALPE